ncbi:MAG: type II toxin-antitoxin system RelE/ParE family toxin [Deltaproteobacteria bacterium]|nr:type II toxin-antitoxin system RelE/ParE family toxin [Deltaproteobacteria bacterium]
MLPIRVLNEARREFAQAVQWYLQQQPSLANDLANEYIACVERANEFPTTGTLVTNQRAKFEVRRFLLDRFPYAVIMACLKEELVVVAVAHQHRKPGYWRKRLAQIKP